jgi:hypothetical protein
MSLQQAENVLKCSTLIVEDLIEIEVSYQLRKLVE